MGLRETAGARGKRAIRRQHRRIFRLTAAQTPATNLRTGLRHHQGCPRIPALPRASSTYAVAENANVAASVSERKGPPLAHARGHTFNETALEQVRRELRQLRPLALGQRDVCCDRLPLHPIVAVDEAVAARIDVRIVDLRRIADQHDLRSLGDSRDDGLHLVRSQLLGLIEDEEPPGN